MTLLKTFSVTAAFAVMTATSAAAASLLAFSEANNNGDTAGFNDATFTLTGTVNGANLSSTHEWDLVSYNDNGDGTHTSGPFPFTDTPFRFPYTAHA